MIVLNQPGLWCQRLTKQLFQGSPGLFLDRDGVVVEEVNYLGRVEQVVVIESIISAIANANRAGIPVVMVTNQSGVGRGYFDWNDFSDVQNYILKYLQEFGAHFDLVLACAYHENAIEPYKISGHDWRKPNAGMLHEAKKLLGVEFEESLIVGDKISDIEAGLAAKLQSGALVSTGHGYEEIRNQTAIVNQLKERNDFNFEIANDGGEAIDRWLLRKGITLR